MLICLYHCVCVKYCCNIDGLRPPTTWIAVGSVRSGLAGGWRGSWRHETPWLGVSARPGICDSMKPFFAPSMPLKRHIPNFGAVLQCCLNCFVVVSLFFMWWLFFYVSDIFPIMISVRFVSAKSPFPDSVSKSPGVNLCTSCQTAKQVGHVTGSSPSAIFSQLSTSSCFSLYLML